MARPYQDGIWPSLSPWTALPRRANRNLIEENWLFQIVVSRISKYWKKCAKNAQTWSKNERVLIISTLCTPGGNRMYTDNHLVICFVENIWKTIWVTNAQYYVPFLHTTHPNLRPFRLQRYNFFLIHRQERGKTLLKHRQCTNQQKNDKQNGKQMAFPNKWKRMFCAEYWRLSDKQSGKQTTNKRQTNDTQLHVGVNSISSNKEMSKWH